MVQVEIALVAAEIILLSVGQRLFFVPIAYIKRRKEGNERKRQQKKINTKNRKEEEDKTRKSGRHNLYAPK